MRHFVVDHGVVVHMLFSAQLIRTVKVRFAVFSTHANINVVAHPVSFQGGGAECKSAIAFLICPNGIDGELLLS